MKIFYALFLFFLLTLPVDASSVERTFTVSDVYFNGTEGETLTQKEIKVTLTPQPYDSFNSPGYYIDEFLLSKASFVSTNADWSEFTNNKLSLLKFNPKKFNSSITYTIRIPISLRTINFYGIYKDEKKLSGTITGKSIYNASTQTTSSTPNKKRKAFPIYIPPPISTTIPTSSPTPEVIELTIYPTNNPPQEVFDRHIGAILTNIAYLTLLIALTIILITIPFIKHYNSKFTLLKELHIEVISSTQFLYNSKPTLPHFTISIHNPSPLPKDIKIEHPKFITTPHKHIKIQHNETYTTHFKINTNQPTTGTIKISHT